MNNTLFPVRNPDAERQRIVAKVYSLLIRLAEEAENRLVHQEPAGAKKTEESIIVQTTPSTSEADFVPTTQNIPP